MSLGGLINKRNALWDHHKNMGVNRYHKALKDVNYQVEGAPESTLASDIESRIGDIPTYEISPEAQQRMDLLEQAGTGLQESAQESTDLARMQAGMVEAPGSAQARRDIQRSTMGQVGALQEMGGSGFLGAISKVGMNEQSAMKDFAMSSLAYKSQSETELMSALRNQSQAESQAAALQSQGLEGMIAEKDKVYQSEMNKNLTGIQYDITKLGMEQQNRAAQAEKQSGIFGGMFS